MKNFLTPKLHSSNSVESARDPIIVNATPSGGTSPSAYYKEVYPPGSRPYRLSEFYSEALLWRGGI